MLRQSRTSTERRPKSLRLLLSLTTGPIVLLIVFVSTFWLAQQRFLDIEQQRELYEGQFESYFKTEIENTIWDLQMGELIELSENIMAFPHIEGLRVMANDAAVVSLGTFRDEAIKKVTPLDVTSFSHMSWRLETAMTPVNYRSILTELVVENSIILIVTIISLGLAGNFLLFQLILGPSRKLREALTQNATGRFDTQLLKEEGAREISENIAGYNQLVLRIKDDYALQKVLDKQTRKHFGNFREFSRLALQVDDPYRNMPSFLLDFLANEPGCIDAGVVIHDPAGQIHKSYLRCGVTDSLVGVVNQRDISHWLNDTTQLPNQSAHSFVQTLIIDEKVVGFMVVVTEYPSSAVREATRLFLYSLSRLVKLSIETSFRRKAELELRDTQKIMYSAIEAMTGVCIFDAQGQILASNSLIKKLLGSESDAEWKTVDDFVANLKNTNRRQAEKIVNWFEAGSSNLETELRLLDGRWLGFTGTILSDKARMLFIRDITLYKKSQISSERDHRMREIGRLGSGLTHDFNNHLQPMMGYVEYAMTLLPKDSEAVPVLRASLRQGEMAKMMTRQILDYLHNQRGETKPLCPREVCDEILASFASKSDVDLNYQLSANTNRWLDVDNSLFYRVIQNLVRNSLAQNGGEPVHVQLIINEIKTGDEINLEFKFIDDCGGFSDEALERGLEPFYTTRPIGHGTGLGLTMIRDFAEASGGSVELRNEEGGACVRLILPSIPKQNPRAKPKELKAVRASIDGLTIAIIEDSLENVRLLKLLLGNKNNRIHVFESFEDVSKNAKNVAREIDLIVSDVNLPDGIGHDAVQTIERFSQRNIPCLFISGDQSAAMTERFHAQQKFLAKPFTNREFLESLYHVLYSDERTAITTESQVLH